MKLYFTGICGTAMGNVACLMKDLGHEVSGSDQDVYPPMSNFLRERGIVVEAGFDPDRLAKGGFDRVVVGNAVTRGNPEVEWLLDTEAIPFVSLPALIRSELLVGRQSIVISGTHGKTTTSSMAAWLLETNFQSPGWLIGGIPASLDSGARAAEPGRPFVIEGDEYDSAFFDKRSKFIHYLPRILVINQIEFDHADIFRDLEDVKRSFRHLIRLVPRNGFLVVNGDDPVTADLLPVDWTRTVRVGMGSSNELQLRHFQEDTRGSRFSLYWKGQPWANLSWTLPGVFNARNAAMAAMAAALAVYPETPRALDLTPLERFKGVRRRQEIRYTDDGLVILEDFAHHPTAVKGLLESLRSRFPAHRIWIVFEPRSNTSTTNIMESAWREAFLQADGLILAPVFRGETLPPERRLNRGALVETMKLRKKEAWATANFEELSACIRSLPHATDTPLCIAFCSNGSFGGVLETWLKDLGGSKKT